MCQKGKEKMQYKITIPDSNKSIYLCNLDELGIKFSVTLNKDKGGYNINFERKESEKIVKKESEKIVKKELDEILEKKKLDEIVKKKEREIVKKKDEVKETEIEDDDVDDLLKLKEEYYDEIKEKYINSEKTGFKGYTPNYIKDIDTDIRENLKIKCDKSKEFKELAIELYKNKDVINIDLEKKLVNYLIEEIKHREFYNKFKIFPLISNIVGICIYMSENLIRGNRYDKKFEKSYVNDVSSRNYMIGEDIINNIESGDTLFINFIYEDIKGELISHKRSGAGGIKKNEFRELIENKLGEILNTQYGIENTILSGIKNKIIKYVADYLMK